MANDKVKFRRALAKWDQLHTEGAYSQPDGRVAILCSAYPNSAVAQETYDEQAALESEATDLAKQLQSRNIAAFVINRARLDDVDEVMNDRTVSHITTIGNGNLSSFWTSTGDTIDWYYLSGASEHLKTGIFTQRHCGGQSNQLNVPLGTFAMRSHANVLAAANRYLPIIMSPEDEAKIQPLHRHQRLTIETVKKLFAYDDSYKDIVYQSDTTGEVNSL